MYLRMCVSTFIIESSLFKLIWESSVCTQVCVDFPPSQFSSIQNRLNLLLTCVIGYMEYSIFTTLKSKLELMSSQKFKKKQMRKKQK